MNQITKKACAAILSAAFFISATFSLSACSKKKDGADGLTPFIGENGNWWIGESDTGVPARGQNGRDGLDGKDGIDGKDGAAGKDGADAIAPSFSYDNETGHLKISCDGGESWTVLANIGDMVSDGKDGRSITSCEINDKGELVISYSDGTGDNLGIIVAADGKDGKDGIDGTDGIDGIDGTDGVGIADVTLDGEGNLTIALTDGTVIPLGNVKGADGENGIDGTDGVGIADVTLDGEGNLTIVLTDGSVIPLGNVKGADGENGINGTDGVTPRLRINPTDKAWEVSYDNGESWQSLGFVSVGETGASGITPMLRIKGGYWEVSYDGGRSWSPLGVKAEGTDGNDGRGIEKLEIIDSYLYVTYTDSAQRVLVGKVGSETAGTGTVVQDVYTDALSFYPNVDGSSYSVAIGNAFNMEHIVIPSTYNGKPVTAIVEKGFDAPQGTNEALRSIQIPETVVSIGENAFSNCCNLEYVFVPASVVQIGFYAFGGVDEVYIDRPQSDVPEGFTDSLGCGTVYWKE